MYRIFTNNSHVFERFRASHDVAFTPDTLDTVGTAGGLLDILEEHLQSGWQLLTVALPPNMPLIRSGICTVVLRKTAQRFDVPGLKHLGRARERRETLARPGSSGRLQALDDLKMIDALFLEQSLREIGIPA